MVALHPRIDSKLALTDQNVWSIAAFVQHLIGYKKKQHHKGNLAPCCSNALTGRIYYLVRQYLESSGIGKIVQRLFWLGGTVACMIMQQTLHAINLCSLRRVAGSIEGELEGTADCGKVQKSWSFWDASSIQVSYEAQILYLLLSLLLIQLSLELHSCNETRPSLITRSLPTTYPTTRLRLRAKQGSGQFINRDYSTASPSKDPS